MEKFLEKQGKLSEGFEPSTNRGFEEENAKRLAEEAKKLKSKYIIGNCG